MRKFSENILLGQPESGKNRKIHLEFFFWNRWCWKLGDVVTTCKLCQYILQLVNGANVHIKADQTQY